jgi:hypothetical protein|tara:strand:- start:781 stop:1797 length:1017 start_codon:yes stop_codon:yes gene_type:complete
LKINNKFAIGCLIQWYEIELIEEYLQSVKNAIDIIDNKENIVIDLYFNCSQALEKTDEEQITISEIKDKYYELLNKLFGYDEDTNSLVGCDYNISSVIDENFDGLYTIANYRRDFNDEYCTKTDVLMWGETDALIPRQTFQILDSLHGSVKDKTPKYVGFFSTCKMWDESWLPIEHNEFTDKPFVDGDTENWWSLRYNMNIDEMNSFNDKVEKLDIRVINQYKFNGCGLVMSSDVVKSGVNIPNSSFFIHEDTAFMLQLQRLFGGEIPQYVIKNILLVHNRKHTKKRSYVKGEMKSDDVSGGRLRHDWYKKASDMSHHNCYNMFNQSKIYTWDDVFDE